MRLLLIAVATLAAAAQSGAQERLDTAAMRNDFFAMFAGDREADTRLLKTSGELLERHPDHPQALAWHGVTLLATGIPNPSMTPEERQAARGHFAQGIGEVDRAVTLAPNDLEVRALRGTLMLPLARQLPPPFAERMLDRAQSDYQQIYDLESSLGRLDNLGTHRLGEVLQGLGDIYSRQEKPAEAEKYYRLIETKLPDTEYAQRAASWLQARQTLPVEKSGCVGCHVP